MIRFSNLKRVILFIGDRLHLTLKDALEDLYLQ